MKYSAEQVKSMSYIKWMETIAQELNAAGFKGGSYNEESGHFDGPYEVGDPLYFFSGAINDYKAIDYLKSIGLVNNGRCPLCGAEIKGGPWQFTNGFQPKENYHICENCYNEGRRVSINPSNNSGCLIALLFAPWGIIKGLFSIILRNSI